MLQYAWKNARQKYPLYRDQTSLRIWAQLSKLTLVSDEAMKAAAATVKLKEEDREENGSRAICGIFFFRKFLHMSKSTITNCFR